jgi:hypothetical protein
MKKQRNRNSIALSDLGIQAVREALALRQWSYDGWADKAFTCTSTVKRLLSGTPVDSSNFYCLLQQLGLTVEDGYIRKKTASATPTLPPGSQYLSSRELLGVLMIGKFTQDKLPRIERALKQLQALLVDAEITFNNEKGMVTVHGEFSEENKELIEATIIHLENLFDYSKVTF